MRKQLEAPDFRKQEAEASVNNYFLWTQEAEAVLKVLVPLPFLPNRISTFLVVVSGH